MTPAQHRRYWREWSQIRKLLTGMGEYSAEDADQERKEIHRKALGYDKSSKDLTNRDLDKIYPAFAAYLVLIKGPSTAPTGPSQPCKRLIWAIEKLQLDEPYLVDISWDQFGTEEWRTLNEEQLTHFRFTATARAAAKKRAAKKQS